MDAFTSEQRLFSTGHSPLYLFSSYVKEISEMLHHFVPERSETITQSWLCGCKVVTTWSGSVMTTCSTSRDDLACRMNRDEPAIERVQGATKSSDANLTTGQPPTAKAAGTGK